MEPMVEDPATVEPEVKEPVEVDQPLNPGGKISHTCRRKGGRFG